ncbi:MAG: M48 family metalloprotease [Gammaproteobacteria bacterium]|nr:M48 family metalloprotease [Gammaproteobacteria bacterium]
MKRLLLATSLSILLPLTSCVENPVTGERNLGLVSEGQEIQIGEENYVATRQMQGGEYYLDPALQDYVNRVGQRVAAQSSRQLPYEFTVLNNDVPNAWALPGGKIAINRGLLVELDNEAELAAVLGHEVVHAAARHSAQQIERSMLLQLGVVAAGVAASDTEYAGLAVGAGLVGAQLINSKYGREAELESDRYGMRYMADAGYDADAAVSLQETFVRLSEGNNPGWLGGLFASHPPSQERVARNREIASQLPDGGELGRSAYQRATEKIRNDKPAYAAYNKGVKALADGNVSSAETLAREALAAVPNEAKFHALLGNIALAKENSSAAFNHFDKAVQLFPRFFEYRIHRGILYMQRDALDAAREDFDVANQLLPTAIAYENLGDIAVKQGRRQDAIDAYSIAAKSDSAAGKRAREKLARLQSGG